MVEDERSSEDKIEQVTIGETLIEINKAAVQYTEATQTFVEDFVFYDRTLLEWANHLNIEIPTGNALDVHNFREVLLKIAINLQIASNYYSVASSILDAISGGNDLKKSSLINTIVDNYSKKNAKRPAGNVIEQMADSYLSNTVSAIVAARIVKNFWKQRYDTLLDVRKVFEQIGMSLHVEIKHLSG